ncbi:Uncharacterised protein [Mycobacteroides abscessus subsp. abscessus]|nr:Uncharacterised protein [Mycobacteroides abscessus subsp. abscessus]SLG89631.1 Uncharacterised protein [Mycobacteroides abscessus subsp. abscessus]
MNQAAESIREVQASPEWITDAAAALLNGIRK